MHIRESELELLEAISANPGIVMSALVESLKGSFSKPHIYLLVSRLQEKGLVLANFGEVGRQGLPQRNLQLTHKGRQVHDLARQITEILEDNSPHNESVVASTAAA